MKPSTYVVDFNAQMSWMDAGRIFCGFYLYFRSLYTYSRLTSLRGYDFARCRMLPMRIARANLKVTTFGRELILINFELLEYSITLRVGQPYLGWGTDTTDI